MSTSRDFLLLAILTMLILFGCNTSQQQTTTVSYTDSEGNSIQLISDKDLTVKTENGITKAYAPDKVLFTGTQKLFYEENGDKGKLRAEKTYQEGLLMQSITYDRQGKVSKRLKNHYKEDELAKSIYFYPGGNKKSELVYGSSDGERTGSVKEWHQNGQFKFKMSLDSQNQYHGEMVLYDEEGNVVREEIYKAGERVDS